MSPTPLLKYQILGESQAMWELSQTVHRIAPHWETALLLGERGTGKELVAHAIHQLGPSKGGELQVVDCAALPAPTAVSLLFGHERGSFTGAVKQHIGLLEAAHGGTLFLDEIGTLPLDMQYRFLRFLEEGTVTRIGGTKPIRVRTRIVAATNIDLNVAVQKGTFLPDLYDRLNILPIRIPPLREREGDCLLLFHHFMGKPGRTLLPDAERFLMEYAFPGNVRELRNLCKRVEVLIDAQDIAREDLMRCVDGLPVHVMI